MKIRQTILQKVDNPATRSRIAAALNLGEQVIAVHMRKNKANGRLTKYDALTAIAKEAEMPIEEILEESNGGVQDTPTFLKFA